MVKKNLKRSLPNFNHDTLLLVNNEYLILYGNIIKKLHTWEVLVIKNIYGIESNYIEILHKLSLEFFSNVEILFLNNDEMSFYFKKYFKNYVNAKYDKELTKMYSIIILDAFENEGKLVKKRHKLIDKLKKINNE